MCQLNPVCCTGGQKHTSDEEQPFNCFHPSLPSLSAFFLEETESHTAQVMLQEPHRGCVPLLTAHSNSPGHADLAAFSYHISDPANSISPSPGCSANPLHGVSCTDPCASCHSANPSKFQVALIKAEPGIYLRGAPSAISMAVIPKDHKSLCKTKQRETRHAVEHCHDREHQASPRAQPHALGLCFLCQPPDLQHRSSSFMLCLFVRASEETPSPADYSKVYFNAFTEFLVDDKANPCSHFVGHCSQWPWWGCCRRRCQHPKCPLWLWHPKE